MVNAMIGLGMRSMLAPPACSAKHSPPPYRKVNCRLASETLQQTNDGRMGVAPGHEGAKPLRCEGRRGFVPPLASTKVALPRGLEPLLPT